MTLLLMHWLIGSCVLKTQDGAVLTLSAPLLSRESRPGDETTPLSPGLCYWWYDLL